MRDNLDFVEPSRNGLVITKQARLSVVYLTTEIVGYHHSEGSLWLSLTLLPDYRGSHG